MRGEKRCLSVFVFLFALNVFLIARNVRTGSVSANGELIGEIVLKIRLPRTIAACMLGGALSVSGFLMQTFFANPIAGPFVLGISSGAKLAVAFALIFTLQRGWTLGSAGMILTAFAGSMLSMGFILLISGKVKQMSLLVVCGVMTGYLCSAVTDFAVTFADDSNIVNLHNWSMGSFSGTGWNSVRAMSLITLTGTVAAFLLSKPIAAYQLGETYARNMGVNLRRAVRVRNGICRSGIIYRRCGAAFDETSFGNIAPSADDSGVFFRRRSILSVLRPDCPNRFCPFGTQYQFCNSGFRCACSNWHHDFPPHGTEINQHEHTERG